MWPDLDVAFSRKDQKFWILTLISLGQPPFPSPWFSVSKQEGRDL